jgi:type I restriction-modification system DNA methylase subunit
VADDVLRGLFKPHEYGDVILPFVILRRLDCVIEPRKDEITSKLDKPVEKLHKNNRLFLLVEKFSSVDLHPDVVDNHTMGQIFEELLRKFSEMSNETSGEHYDIKIYGQELNQQTYSICKSDLLISVTIISLQIDLNKFYRHKF